MQFMHDYRRIPVLRDLNEGAMMIEEIQVVENEIQAEKAPVFFGCPMECLMKRGVHWLCWSD